MTFNFRLLCSNRILFGAICDIILTKLKNNIQSLLNLAMIRYIYTIYAIFVKLTINIPNKYNNMVIQNCPNGNETFITFDDFIVRTIIRENDRKELLIDREKVILTFESSILIGKVQSYNSKLDYCCVLVTLDGFIEQYFLICCS